MYYNKGGFLSTDARVRDLLKEAKKNGNPLLEKFQIRYPDRTLNEEINSIHVACVSSDNSRAGFEHQEFIDLVEVVITTKRLDYPTAVDVIKGVSSEIIHILRNDDYLGQRLIVRSVKPVHDTDTYVLKKGHMLLQFKTEPLIFDDDDERYYVCKILAGKLEEE